MNFDGHLRVFPMQLDFNFDERGRGRSGRGRGLKREN